MARIGDVTRMLDISADTLRYYEKIHLLPPVSRNAAGVRDYGTKDISRLKFIKRAQRMGFSLKEIGHLLDFREAPQDARLDVRELAGEKLGELEEHLRELSTLRDELKLLVSLCAGSEDGCPILESLDED